MNRRVFEPSPLGSNEISLFSLLLALTIFMTVVFFIEARRKGFGSWEVWGVLGITILCFFFTIYFLPPLFGIPLNQVIIDDRVLIIRKTICFIPVEKRYPISEIHELSFEEEWGERGDVPVICVRDYRGNKLTEIQEQSLREPIEVVKELCKRKQIKLAWRRDDHSGYKIRRYDISSIVREQEGSIDE